MPELTLAIKRSVDRDRQAGRYLLTGSVNLLQLPRLADSLAGRMECLYLQPLTEAEKEGAAGDFLERWLAGELEPELPGQSDRGGLSLPQRLVAGGYPEACFRRPQRARRWQRQYLQSIIERDIHDVAEVKDGADVAQLLEYLANQTASLLNVSATANALRHVRKTVEYYLEILERLFLIRRLPAWYSNRGKRLVKSPKIHLCDSGLDAAACNAWPRLPVAAFRVGWCSTMAPPCCPSTASATSWQHRWRNSGGTDRHARNHYQPHGGPKHS